MTKFSILNKEEIASFREIYFALYNKSIPAGIPEAERTEFIRNIMDKIFHDSIQGTIDKGFTFSDKELKKINDEFYRLVVSFESEFSGKYS